MDRRGDPMPAGSLPPRAPRVPVAPDMRVLAAIAGLLILVVVGITIAVWLILDLRRATVDFTEREVEYAAAVGDIALISKTLANDERGYLISGSDEFLRGVVTVKQMDAAPRGVASREAWLAARFGQREVPRSELVACVLEALGRRGERA